MRLCLTGLLVGLGYGAYAVTSVYATAPLPVQTVILLGVGAVGSCAGWLLEIGRAHV